LRACVRLRLRLRLRVRFRLRLRLLALGVVLEDVVDNLILIERDRLRLAVAAERHERPDVRQEVREGDGLAQVHLRPRLQPHVLIDHVVRRLAREDDERHARERRIPLQPVAHREPVHPRELGREQDEIGPVRGRDLHPHVPVVHHLDGAAEVPELRTELSRERGVTLKHEDFGHIAGPRSHDRQGCPRYRPPETSVKRERGEEPPKYPAR
jgi:hypothetical protein